MTIADHTVHGMITTLEEAGRETIDHDRGTAMMTEDMEMDMGAEKDITIDTMIEEIIIEVTKEREYHTMTIIQLFLIQNNPPIHHQ
jgi:methylmalonyl-CoA mutase cobalamin-binding subunit